MDNFNFIVDNATSRSSIGVQQNNTQRRNESSFAMLSADALEKNKETLTQQRMYLAADVERNSTQAKIDEIEQELVKRKSTATTNPESAPAAPAITSPSTQEKISSMGGNVGAGALVVGITAFTISAMGGNKNPMWFALGGAVIGSIGAFALTKKIQEKQDKK